MQYNQVWVGTVACVKIQMKGVCPYPDCARCNKKMWSLFSVRMPGREVVAAKSGDSGWGRYRVVFRMVLRSGSTLRGTKKRKVDRSRPSLPPSGSGNRSLYHSIPPPVHDIAILVSSFAARFTPDVAMFVSFLSAAFSSSIVSFSRSIASFSPSAFA